jgi:thiopurine S-methyltransferase
VEPEFWLERWRNGEIGFHQPVANPVLVDHWHRLALEPGSTVFVPLCGKSLDMAWLADQGHRIVGVELSELAIDEFFASQGLEPAAEHAGPLTVKRAGAYELWCGDFFALPAAATADAAAVYDRASLIALPPELRVAYADHLTRRAKAAWAPILLISLEYDQTLADGPPHAVLRQEIDELFAARCDIEEIHRAAEAVGSPRLRAAGIERFEEAAYLLRPHGSAPTE